MNGIADVLALIDSDQDANSGIFTSRGEFLKQRATRQAFIAVIRAYREALSMHPLAAYPYDESIRSRKLSPQVVEFMADVLNVSKRTLGNNPALFRQWQQIVAGEDIPNAGSIITRCGAAYRRLGLVPFDYFLLVRRGRKRHPNGAPLQAGVS
jgi:hypothetical protein